MWSPPGRRGGQGSVEGLHAVLEAQALSGRLAQASPSKPASLAMRQIFPLLWLCEQKARHFPFRPVSPAPGQPGLAQDSPGAKGCSQHSSPVFIALSFSDTVTELSGNRCSLCGPPHAVKTEASLAISPPPRPPPPRDVHFPHRDSLGLPKSLGERGIEGK